MPSLTHLDVRPGVCFFTTSFCLDKVGDLTGAYIHGNPIIIKFGGKINSHLGVFLF